MELSKAKELAAGYLLNKENKVVIITSNFGVFLNNEESQIAEYAKNNNLDHFVFRNEEEVKTETKK